MSITEPALDTVRTVFATVVSPLIYTAHLPYEGLAVFAQWRATSEDNSRLAKELSRQAIALQRLSALEAENARLRALLGSAERVVGRERFAAVIGVTPDPRRSQLILDRGDGQGIGLGDAVLGAEGLVGQIIETGALSSRVLLMMISPIAPRGGPQWLRPGSRAGPGRPQPALSVKPGRHPPWRCACHLGLGGRFLGHPVARVCPWRLYERRLFDGPRRAMAPLRRLQDVVVLSWPAASVPLGPASGSQPRAPES